jgi:hypothetical protein
MASPHREPMMCARPHRRPGTEAGLEERTKQARRWGGAPAQCGHVNETTAWSTYVAAMRDHMAATERLRERITFYVGRDLHEPVAPPEQDMEVWLALLSDCEEAARAHREALEGWRYARVRRAA